MPPKIGRLPVKSGVLECMEILLLLVETKTTYFAVEGMNVANSCELDMPVPFNRTKSHCYC